MNGLPISSRYLPATACLAIPQLEARDQEVQRGRLDFIENYKNVLSEQFPEETKESM